MKLNKLIKIQLLFSLIGAIGALVWWFSMPLFLPVSEAAENFQEMILDHSWIPVNLIGLASILMITLGFPGFYMRDPEKFNRLGYIGLIIATTGLILFTAIQYYETFLWPAAAHLYPELLQTKGELVSGNLSVVAGLIVSGIFLGAGYILFGISSLKAKIGSKLPIWFLMVGAPVFGNAVIFPVRTVGLLLFCTGTIWLSVNVRKSYI